MALRPYCENAEVRAALGVNVVELPDAVLNLPIYSIGLMRELNKLSPSLPASFSALVGRDQGGLSELEAALVASVRLFSTYACARQVSVSLASMLPKDVGDGKASVSRFAGAPYRETMDRVEAMYQSTRRATLASLAAVAGEAVVPVALAPHFAAAGRQYDPVTG